MLTIAAVYGQQQSGQGVNSYRSAKELALGERLAAEMRRKSTPLNNADVTAYVNRMGAKLAEHLPNGYVYQITVVENDLGGVTYEPVALPGGQIFVSEQLIAASQSEDEFAGMLAHGMAHVAARDQTAPGPASAVWVDWQDGQIPLGMLSFQRARERLADRLAVQAMAAAVYDPAGLVSYLSRVQPENGPDRLKTIRAEIATLPPHAYRTGSDFETVQRQVRALKPQNEVKPSLLRK